MEKKEIIRLLQSNKPPCLETLRGSLIEFNEAEKTMLMEFDAIPEFCHSGAQIVQGGFVTGMLDSSMAHLIIALEKFQYNPVSLDINVSFIAPAHPGTLAAESKILRMGKSIVFAYATMKQNDAMIASATSTIKLFPISKKPL
ncbi:MAG: PaaI family thioesterase [Gammaproteobacteria bacterium]|nr:PaaI family thioesterase [Gammaproteobacteria bacterium]